MRVEYSKRAIRDLKQVATYYHETAGEKVAEDISCRIAEVIERVRRTPFSAPALAQRPMLRVVLLIKYPYKIFYRVKPDVILIYHIRHTSRRPWTGEGA